jgi:DNA repair exonuclease SbcCD ATPase subunit
MKTNKILLDSVSIQGFRGFSDEETIKLDAPVNILFGIVGGGKTSTLESIEWNLFGNTGNAEFNRSDDDIVNSLAKEINVALNLVYNGKKIEVRRTKKRNKRTMNLTITGMEVKDSDDALFQLLRLTFSDFIRAVFLHQETLNSLADENADRDRAIDRLLGLEMLSNITDALPMSYIRSKEKDMIGRLDGLKSQINGNIVEARRNERNHIKNCRQSGIEESQIEFEHIRNIFSELNTSVNKLSIEAGLEKMSELLPSSPEQLEDYTINIQNKIKKIRDRFVPKQIEKFNDSIATLTSLRSKYVVLVSQESGARLNLTEITKKYGTLVSSNRKIEKMKNKIKSLENKKTSLDVRYGVVKSSVEYLKEDRPTSCPVCDRAFSKSVDRKGVLGKLKQELEEHENKEINQIEEKIDFLIKQQKELCGQVKKIEKAVEELDDAKSELRSFISEKISKEVSKPLKTTDKIDKLLGIKIDDLKKEVDAFVTSFADKNKELEKLEEKTKKVSLVCAVLRDRIRIEKIADIEKSAEFNKMERSVQALGKLKSELETLSQSVSEFQVNQAGTMLKESMSLIDQYYKKLCNHQFYSDIKIEHEAQSRGGKMCNSYTIVCFNPKNDEETVANKKLSTGQINCVALSIYLALAKMGMMKNNVGFLIMDDPSQNLDEDHKKSLCELLQEVSKEKQIILATNDSQFKDMLLTTFDEKNVNNYNYKRWEQDKPVIEHS